MDAKEEANDAVNVSKVHASEQWDERNKKIGEKMQKDNNEYDGLINKLNGRSNQGIKVIS